jgi:DNA-binding LacI/PurR family transcriptional regulator
MVTIKDVAKKAKVSVSTVSRVINNKPDVSKKTRERVFQVIKEINYQPNYIARSLVNGKTNTVGFFYRDITGFGITHPFAIEVINGIYSELYKHNLDLTFFIKDTKLLNSTLSITDVCRRKKVDGAILSGFREYEHYAKDIRGTSIPIVLIDFPIEGRRVSYVTSDNLGGSIKAIEHLIGLGHKKIGFINGGLWAHVSRERLKGYRQALKKYNISFKENLVEETDFTPETAENAVEKLIYNNRDITAFFCASDLIAAGAIKRLKEMGFRIPTDISIVGFDDIEQSKSYRPPLTTVQQDKRKIGCEAVKLIVKMINDNKYVPQRIKLPTKLVIRQSTTKIKK